MNSKLSTVGVLGVLAGLMVMPSVSPELGKPEMGTTRPPRHTGLVSRRQTRRRWA
jgi:hypothetical protein